MLPRGEPSEGWKVMEELAKLQERKNGGDQEPLNDCARLVGEFEEPPSPSSASSLARDVWPAPMAPEAFQGIAGEFVETVLPHTEADPAALLVQFLVAAGNLIGRGPYCRVEATEHRCNLFAGAVGRTSKGRKGTSLDHVRVLIRLIDSEWEKAHILGGLASGEGLIWAVRDPIEKREPIRENKVVTGYQMVEMDPGVSDKRLLVVESELASVLNVIARDGSTLSEVIRNAWDRGDLQITNKNSPARATDAHISILGHITQDELRATLTATDKASGFANRFLWICTRRSKVLPEGGHVPEDQLHAIADRLRAVVTSAEKSMLVTRDEPAKNAWALVYPDLSEGEPGLFGAATNRAEAQVLRLSLLYAVLDRSRSIRVTHLKAALAVWSYAEASARYIFGDAIGDEVADTIDQALRQAGDEGMTRTEIYRLFGANRPAERIAAALTLLREYRRVRSETTRTAGRPVERWFSTVGR